MNAFPTYLYGGKEYSLPYWLPRGKKGNVEVKIEFEPAGKTLPIVSIRNSIFMGLPQSNLLLDKPLGIHKLLEWEPGDRAMVRSVWMTSMPQEIEQHARQLKRLYGRVLVGGLGLGLAVALLEEMDAVESIVVVEKNKNVIDLVKPHMPCEKTTVVHGDLHEFLAGVQGLDLFDCAFYDTWCPTGERVLMKEVFPLRKLSQGIVPQENIECWNEDEMIGQIWVNMTMMLPGWFSDLPADSPVKVMMSISQERFEGLKESHGLGWYFERWLRRTWPGKESAERMLAQFCRTIKDPIRFEREWMS